MIVTRIDYTITPEQVQEVLAAYPTLGNTGFPTRGRSIDAEPFSADYLAQELPLTVAILRTVPRTRSKSISVYNVKHRLEPIVGYLTNGACTVACLLAGFEIEIVPGSPNALIGVHRSWIRHQFALGNGQVPYAFVGPLSGCDLQILKMK